MKDWRAELVREELELELWWGEFEEPEDGDIYSLARRKKAHLDRMFKRLQQKNQ